MVAKDGVLGKIETSFQPHGRGLGIQTATGPELWSFPTQTHIVFYQIHDDRIVIIRFVPARMDIEEEMLSFLKEHFGSSIET